MRQNAGEHKETKVLFRIYSELNDFIRSEFRQVAFEYYYHGPLIVKEAIENLGIPHSSVDLILVNGSPVDFNYRLADNDYISVYPVFELLDVSSLTKVRKEPLREIRFIVDSHLGKLAKYLRIMGFDTLYRNDYDDREIRFLAQLQRRVILTRDRGLLMAKNAERGYYVRAVDTEEQVREVIRKFDLYEKINPLSRCLICNHKLVKLPPGGIQPEVFDQEGKPFPEFYRCYNCNKFFWKGSHYKRMIETILRYLEK